ncbi:E3 ubiquitin-protein ligase Os04g0590900-like [Triticum dicoccoides]|uniref:E3 ubiquitin-protein ligase Os04g0590900-like n=1 Tax=Triticum dicoccoides TaxID=85692 RepID=UPI001891B362|nr:E3 ubiquitin-protein ligase Os04g0590900-like [Triticum dicoccoides]
MARWPPGFPGFPLPPPTWPYRSSMPPPPPPSGGSSQGRTVAGTFGGLVACLLVGLAVCSLCKRRRNSRARAAAAPAQSVAAADRAQNLTESGGVRVDVRQLHRACAVSPTAGLPAFTYSLSVKHNVSGGGEEAATCSVCLGAMQVGETVRLLPACLHLYHAECIDPWLDAHSTCPLCRSDTDPSAV